jgi:hypothetical protein
MTKKEKKIITKPEEGVFKGIYDLFFMYRFVWFFGCFYLKIVWTKDTSVFFRLTSHLQVWGIFVFAIIW